MLEEYTDTSLMKPSKEKIRLGKEKPFVMIQAGDSHLESSSMEKPLVLLAGSDMSMSQQRPGSREGHQPPGLH